MEPLAHKAKAQAHGEGLKISCVPGSLYKLEGVFFGFVCAQYCMCFAFGFVTGDEYTAQTTYVPNPSFFSLSLAAAVGLFAHVFVRFSNRVI